MNKLLLLLALLVAAPAFAQQVPAPINAPASVTSGHGLCATANRQQAADCGAIPGTVTSVTASSPLSSSGGVTPNITIASPLSVGVGGTGNNTATAHSVPINEGSSAQANTGTLGAGQLLIGQGAGTDPAPKTISGDCTVAGTGAITCSATGGATFGGLATLAGSAQGQVIYWAGSAWTLLSPGTSGQPLQSQGTGANPQFASMRQAISSRASVYSGGMTNYNFPVWGTGTLIASFAQADNVVPISGTFHNLRVQLTSAPGTGNSVTIALYKNNSATAITVTISGTNTTGSDTTDSVTVSAGDLVAYDIVTSASITGAYIEAGIEFDNP